MIIYKITDKRNGKIYVGQDSLDRPGYFGSGIIISKLVLKYGTDNFHKETLEKCESKKELNEREIFWIDKLKANNKNIGYNLTNGGEGGNTLISEESRKRRSLKYMGNGNPFFGKKHTEETLKNISNSKEGKSFHTTESKSRISIKMKELICAGIIDRTNISDEERTRRSILMKTNNPLKRDDVKQRVSLSMTGEKNPSAKKWVFKNRNNEEVIIIGAFRKFCIDNNLSHKSMRLIACNKRKDKWCNGWTVYHYNQ